MKPWGLLTIDVNKVPLDSKLRYGERGKAIVSVQNVVFFVLLEDIQADGEDIQDNGDVSAYEYDIVSNTLEHRKVPREDIRVAGEMYRGHPSLVVMREKLQELEAVSAT